jgi:hypothetical protein
LPDSACGADLHLAKFLDKEWGTEPVVEVQLGARWHPLRQLNHHLARLANLGLHVGMVQSVVPSDLEPQTEKKSETKDKTITENIVSLSQEENYKRRRKVQKRVGKK